MIVASSLLFPPTAWTVADPVSVLLPSIHGASGQGDTVSTIDGTSRLAGDAPRQGLLATARFELPHMRTAYSSTYVRTDGKNELVVSTVPRNYQDVKGLWQSVRTDLVQTSTGSFRYEAPHVPFRALIADDGRYRFYPDRGNARRWVQLRLSGSPDAIPRIDPSGMFTLDGRDIDVQLAIENDRIKASILLSDQLAPTSWAIPMLVHGGLRVRSDLAVVDAQARVVARIEPPFAVDARGSRRNLAWSVRSGYLQMTLDPSGLTYPILVDPTIALPTDTSDFEFSTTTAASTGCSSTITGATTNRFGWNGATARMLTMASHFSSVGIYRAATISSANVTHRISSLTGSVFGFPTSFYDNSDNALPLAGTCADLNTGRTWLWNNSSINTGATIWPDGLVVGGRYVQGVEIQVQALVNRVGWSFNNAMVFYMYPIGDQGGGTYYQSLATVEHTTYAAPTLNITYTNETTPPSPPTTVNDGTGVDIDAQASLTSLSANWSGASDSGSGLQNYDYCFSTSVTGADCAAGAVVIWTTTVATGITASPLSLSAGTTYYACVRARDNAGNVGTATCSDGVIYDVTPPNVPTLVSPANGASLTAKPTFTATYSDPPPGSQGQVNFQVCSNSTCTAVVTSGSSTTNLSSGTNGSWTPVTLAGGSYWWRAQNVDGAALTSGWSATWSFALNYPPLAPILLSPASGAWVTTLTPTLTAQFKHGDPSETGYLTFELCVTSAPDPWSANCGASYATGTSPAGLVDGASGSWAPNTELANGTTYYWRVRGVDQNSPPGPWSAVQSFTIDTAAPSKPPNLRVTLRGQGAITIAWDASTDPVPGSGGVTYDVETSTDGVSYTPQCTGIVGLTCLRGGLGSQTKVFFRVRACDAVNNCSAWSYLNDTTGTGYNLRTSVSSTILTNAVNRQATVTSAAATTTTRITQGSTTGWYIFNPNVNNAGAESAVEPANTPWSATGVGWVIDDYAGKVADGGPIQVVVQTNASNATSDGQIQCRAFKITTSAGSITGNTFLGKQTIATDVINNASTVITCDLAGLASQTTFAANEALYVEVWMEVYSGAGAGTAFVTMTAEDTTSFIAAPLAGFAPNIPTPLVSPADLAVTTTTPTMTAPYSHPSATSGAVEFQIATDTAFTNVVEAGSSPTVASGTNGSYTSQNLTLATTYYWRARAKDNYSRTSAWTAYRTLTVTSAPATPVNVSPPNLGFSSLSPTLTATAFSDPNAGATHQASRWQVRTQTGSYLSPVADSGVTTVNLTSWTVPGPLTDGSSYCFHVRYQDNLNAWSAWSADTCFTATATPPFTVTSTTPSSGPQGRIGLTVQINGSGFVSGATVTFSGTGITVTSTTFVSASRIDITVTIGSSAATTARDVTVTNPDLTTATGTGVFTVTAASISLSLSTLGYFDAARDTTSPYAIGFGGIIAGFSRDIGPTGSGQTTPGAAVQVIVTADTDTRLQVSSTDWTNGPYIMPAAQLAWKHFGVAEAWAAMTTTNTNIQGPTTPGTTTYSYDYRLTFPAAQPTGLYTGAITYTAIGAA